MTTSRAEQDVPPAVIIEVVSADDTSASYRRRLERARAYGAEVDVLVDLFTPGGVRVELLTPDPVDPAGWRTVKVSTDEGTPIRVPRLGIDIAGGRELVVSDEHGRWMSGDDAIQRVRQSDERAARLAERLRALGEDPDQL